MFLFHQSIVTFVDILAWSLLVLAFLGFYATYKFFRWWKALAPSRLLGALFATALIIDVASIPLIFLALRRLIDPDAPPYPFGIVLLGIALIILLGAKVVQVWLFRDLDNAVNSGEPQMETQNQREDREFGEQRRALEIEHGEDETYDRSGTNS